MELTDKNDDSLFASSGSAYVSCRRKWVMRREEEHTSDYDSNRDQEGEGSDGSYAAVSGVEAATHLEFKAICHNDDDSNGSDGYLEVYQARTIGRDESNGYLQPRPPVVKYVEFQPRENEIELRFNKNGDLLEMHGNMKLFDIKPKRANKKTPDQTPSTTTKIVTCVPKEQFEELKRTNAMMKIFIAILIGLFLGALCVFLLAWFGILNGKVCPPSPIFKNCVFDSPLKYKFSMGENATISYVLPIFPNSSTLSVDLHRTRVRIQDERLLNIDNVNKQMTASSESGRVSTKFSASDGMMTVTIKIQETQCHDHGYITTNISGILVLYIELEIAAPIRPCPQAEQFDWNSSDFINCSACVGNATWNVTWYREGNGTYNPVPKTNVSLLVPFIYGQDERMVSTVDYNLGIIFFKLENRLVFCSDGGIYKISVLTESTEQNVSINVTVKGSLESCLPTWVIKLIDPSISRTCNVCIGETDFTNLTITQESPEATNVSSVLLKGNTTNNISFRNNLMVKTSLTSGLISAVFEWSRVECYDEGFYHIVAVTNSGGSRKNIRITVDDFAFLKQPDIIQEDGKRGGFAEGFNLSLSCSVNPVGCKKPEIFMSLLNRNTTAECTPKPLSTGNISESYECSLTWTEFNISSNFNGTSFHCRYNYTHNNGSQIMFLSNLTVFVIPSSICKTAGCTMSHPLGGRFFIECDKDKQPPYRPWEKKCPEPLVFVPDSVACNGMCNYAGR